MPLPPGYRDPERPLEATRDIVVFACGDPAHAEHDSIAIAACTSLPPEILARVDVKVVGPIRPEYLQGLPPGVRVLIVDTISGPPGEVADVPLIELSGREQPVIASSTPNQPLDEVVAIAQLLRDEPISGRLVGLGVESIDLRKAADPGAVETLRDAVVRAIEELGAA